MKNIRLEKPNPFQLFLGVLIFFLKPLSMPKEVETIGKYRLVSKISKDVFNNFFIGLYTDGSRTVFIKTWSGWIPDNNYHALINEYVTLSVVRKLLRDSSYKDTIRVPEVYDILISSHSVSVVFEYIEGKHLDQFSKEYRRDAVLKILNCLRDISRNIPYEETLSLRRRNWQNYVFTSPLVLLGIMMFYPSKLGLAFRAFFKNSASLSDLSKERLVLAHRDISYENIIIADKKIYLVDFEEMALAPESADIAYCFTHPDFKDIREEVLHAFKKKANGFLLAHVKTHTLINTRHIKERCEYLSLLLRNLIRTDGNRDKSEEGDYICEWHSSLSPSLRKEWRELWNQASAASIFNAPEWFETSVEAFSHQKTRFLTIRDKSDGALVGILPLIKTRLFALWVYRQPGYEFVDRFSMLVSDSKKGVAEEMVRHLSEIGNVYLNGLADENLAPFSLKKSRASVFFFDWNPYIDYAVYRSLPNHKSKSLKKAEKTFGSVKFIHATEQLAYYLKQAFEIDCLSSKQKKGKGVFDRPDTQMFFSKLAEKCPESMFVDLLFFGEKPVAYSIGFLYKGVYRCSQKAHLSEYDRYRPGGIAYRKFLDALADKDVQEVDIGRGYDQFKQDFTKTTRRLSIAVVSKNIFIRWYVQQCFMLRERIYNFLSAHPSFYLRYKHFLQTFYKDYKEGKSGSGESSESSTPPLSSSPGNKPTLRIAIPAYNEEKSIQNILHSLLRQRRNNFDLESIKVYADACTDGTVEKVLSVHEVAPLVSVSENKERRGKVRQLNFIFRECESDLLLVLDADVDLCGDDFLDTLVKTAISDDKGVMFAAHQIPLRPRNVIGRMFHASFLLWDYIRLSDSNKDHVQNFYGAATLYKKHFARTLSLPEVVRDMRTYLYLTAQKSGGFRYVEDAAIVYWPPHTAHDFFALRKRVFGSADEKNILRGIFGSDIDHLHVVSMKNKWKGIFRFSRDYPFYLFPALFLSWLLSELSKRNKTNHSLLWETSASTKKSCKE